MNKTSKIILTGLFVALLSSGLPNFVTQDAYAAANITYTAATATTTTITITFSENMDSGSDSSGDWTISTGQTVSSESHVDGTNTMTLTLASALDTDATPTVTYAENGNITDTNGLETDTIVVGGVVATDGIVPTVVSATTTSSTTIGITFSEDIVDTASDLDDYTINGVAGGSDISAISVSGAILTLTTNGYSILNGETVTVTFDGEANELEDTGTLNDVADFTNQAVTNNVPKVETKKGGSDCYDCKPPTLQESHITILNNDYVVATGDDPLHITANVGDKVTVILNVTDNKPVDDFKFAGLYTNYQDKPSDMNSFYANNYDNLKQISTSFYEWNVRSDDTAYDYDGTLSWSENNPEIITDVITDDNFKFKNDENNMVQYFMMPFTFTINEHMDSTKIVAKVYDGSYNRLHVTLPVVLDVAGNDPLNFENLGKQKTLGFFDEVVLIQSISDWDDSQDNTEKLAQLLGVSEDSIPLWTVNLANWVAEDKIDSADLIVAVEYLINQSDESVTISFSH